MPRALEVSDVLFKGEEKCRFGIADRMIKICWEKYLDDIYLSRTAFIYKGPIVIQETDMTIQNTIPL